MTVNEIFRDLSANAVKGVMFHTQMADYYNFLNLPGYKRAHEYHARCEIKSLRKLHKFYVARYNKLIEEKPVDYPGVIPTSWYRYTQMDVDVNTKRNAVKAGIEKWVEWENETKKMYERMYREALAIGEVTVALEIGCLADATGRELTKAQRAHIELANADYNISYILGEQERIRDKYKNR